MTKNVKQLLVVVGLLVALLLTACDVTPTVTVEPTTQQTTQPTQTVEESELTYVNGELVQQPRVRDYTYMWWRDGFQKGINQIMMQTGYYGMALSPQTGTIARIGTIEQELTWEQAAKEDNSIINGFNGFGGGYMLIDADGNEHRSNGMEPIGGGSIASRILNSGRYMQRVDMMCLKFKDEDDIKGRVEVSAMPQYFSIEYTLHSPGKKRENVGLKFWITLPEDYTDITTGLNNRAITARNASGEGVTFVIPYVYGTSCYAEDGKVYFVLSSTTLEKNTFTGFGVVGIPSANASIADAERYVKNESVVASSVQIAPYEDKDMEVTYDMNKGYLSFDMNNMLRGNTTVFNDETKRNTLDRMKFTITNNSDVDIHLPIQFHKEKNFPVTGMSPLLRDAETGEPIGVQVQLSKNWHGYTTNPDNNYAALDDPKRFYSGEWFQGYTILDIPAGKSVTYEICITYATWGGVYACSHAQLSLAGWGGNYQQWETSAIGSFGESFCYDVETAHGRSFIDDIRPLAINGMGGKYGWTGCNGGGNMLMYNNYKGGKFIYYKQAKTQFRKQGPNLCEVTWTGITTDEAVRFEITANLPRTNDASRAYHTFKYTFLKDVKFDRMIFYQFGADNYNDNQWNYMAVGNDDGTVSFEIDGVTYSGEFETPIRENEGYVGSQDTMQRIDIGGEGLWFAFTKCVKLPHKNGPEANRTLNVISYNANLNGVEYTKPSFNLRHSDNFGIDCLLVELCPPAAVGNTINAGSTVEGVVEYINLPVTKNVYYGDSKVMRSFNSSDFNTYKLAYAYCTAGKYTTTATVGTVTKQIPIYVECASGDVLAEITVTGGISYVPLTFTNVPYYKGYHLEQKNGDTWEKVDQSTFGNDYWQAWFDADTKTYELTYNVEHSGDKNAQYFYRLVKD